MMNITDVLLSNPGDGHIAMIDGEREYTYGQLRAAVVHLAAQIEAGPTTIGDRIGLLARNSYFWVVAYLATLYAGRVAVPLANTTTPADIRRQLDWVGAEVVLVERSLARRFAPVLDESATLDEGALDGATDRASAWAPTNVAADTDAVLQLTSGTTSAPRAVRVSHANIAANTESIVDYLGLRHDDRMLVVLPFSYCFGASLLHTHLRVGGSVVLCNTLAFPETVVEMIDRHACTGLAGVPSTYQLLLRASSLGSRALVSLRHLQQAGGKLAPALVDELVGAQPGARVFVMYGQTEATARLSYLPPDDIVTRRGSVGRGIPGVRLRVVDAADHDVAPGEVGEVVAVGSNIAKGYWNDPEATATRFRDGTLRTGDLATVDEDGYVYIVDRAADFIKSWGVRVSSQEIEDAALQLPNVVSAAAVGVPDDVAGEAIVLFVVPRGELEPGAVLSSLRRSLAKHMVPTEVRIVSSMPLNSNGKLVKSELRRLATANTENRGRAE